MNGCDSDCLLSAYLPPSSRKAGLWRTRQSKLLNRYQPCLSTDGSLKAQYVYEAGIDRPVKATISNQDYCFVQDILGNVIALTDTSGAIVEQYEFDIYGKPTIKDGNGNPLTVAKTPFLFTGREYDNETGLYHYRARAYSPDLGRFLQVDKISFSGGDNNLYRYCSNNPINNVDPSGKIGPLGWAAAVAVGVLIFAAVYSAQTYSKMEANKEYARTLPGTPITLHGSSYDDLTPAGRDAVDIHEAVHQGQPLFRGNETEAYQVEYGYEKEKLNDPNSNLTEAERAELKMLMDDSMDHLVKFKKDCP